LVKIACLRATSKDFFPLRLTSTVFSLDSVFPLPYHLETLTVWGVTMSSKKKRTQEKDRPRHTEQDPGPSESLSTVSKAYSDRKGLPRKATRILSRPGFQLLEGFRQALSPGEDGQFTYEGLRRDCGIGSRSSVAKGLNELQSLTVIEYTSERIGGKVHGLKVKLLGFPRACLRFLRVRSPAIVGPRPSYVPGCRNVRPDVERSPWGSVSISHRH